VESFLKEGIYSVSICFGIDIVDINRIKTIIGKRKNFISKVFTDDYASRFAAKEAFLKAVPGWQGKLNWRELEVKNDAFGKPVISLSKKSRFKLNKKKVELTISHDRNYAIALVAVEGR